jgi:hypothetical protein
MKEKDKELVVSLDRIPNFEEFLNQMKVAPTGFGAVILKYIYKNLFFHSIDHKEEYVKYYSIEYDTIDDYLLKKVGLEITTAESSRRHILRIERLSSLIDPAYEDNFLEMFLHKLEVYRED